MNRNSLLSLAIVLVLSASTAVGAETNYSIRCLMNGTDDAGKPIKPFVRIYSIDMAHNQTCEIENEVCDKPSPFHGSGQTLILFPGTGDKSFDFTANFDQATDTLFEETFLFGKRIGKLTGHCTRRAFVAFS